MTEYIGIAVTIAQREQLERECEKEGYESLSAFVRERRLFPESTAQDDIHRLAKEESPAAQRVSDLEAELAAERQKVQILEGSLEALRELLAEAEMRATVEKWARDR